MAESEDRKLYAKFIARKKAREAAAYAASPIPDGVTDSVDLSRIAPPGTPTVQTDFGDVIPAATPASKPTPSWKELLPETKASNPRTELKLPTLPYDTYTSRKPAWNADEAVAQVEETIKQGVRPSGSKPGIFHPTQSLQEVARETLREMTPEDIFRHRVETFLDERNSESVREKAREKLDADWDTPEYKAIRESIHGSTKIVDEAIKEWQAEYQKREPGWRAQSTENARSATARGNAWTDQNRLMSGFPETAYAGRVIAETGHHYKPQEQSDFDAARYFLDHARYYQNTYSELEQAIHAQPQKEMGPMEKAFRYTTIPGLLATGAQAIFSKDKAGKSRFDQFLHGIAPRNVEDAVSFGWAETVHLSRLNSINAKAARGEELTDGEKAMAGAYLVSLDAQAGLQMFGGATTAEKFGQFIGENVPFLIEMGLTGGLGGAAAGAVRGLARKGIVNGIQMAGKSGAKELAGAALKSSAGRYAAKQGANIAGSLIGGATMAPFSQTTYRNYAQRTNDQYDVGLDAEGNYTARLARPTSEWERGWKSYVSAGVELGSEFWGTFAGAGRIFPRWMQKTKVGEALAPIRKFTQTPGGRRFDNYVGDVFKWNGGTMEALEEEFSNALEPILTGETERLKENFSPEAQFNTILGVVAMSTAMGAVRTPIVAFDHARHARTGAKLRSQISDPTLSESLQQIMASGTRQEQAQKLGQIDWSAVSMQDRAAAMDYVAHQVEGRVTQDMQEAMREQAAAAEAQRRFEQRKNRDTGNLETVTDLEGNSFYLAGGTLEAGENGTADGTVFVIDPKTGETSQRSVEELKRGETTTPEQYETEFRQQLETISQAEAEAAAVEEIVEEANAAGEDPTPRVAAYKGIDLNALAGETVTLADGSQAYINQVSTDRNGAVEIDAVPVDPSTGQLLTNENGEEAHTLLDVRSIVAPPRQEQQQPQSAQTAPETQTAEQSAQENSQSTQIGTPDNTTTQSQNRIGSANLEPEIDENGLPFVTASNGSIDFGQIAEETGLTPAPIRLSTGENRVGPDGKNHGYGLAHIEAGHGDQIRNAGYDSVEQFVELVGKQYTDIREGAKIGENQTYLLELPDNHNNTLFVQLSKDGAYWNVNSAGIFKKRYSRRKPEVYSVPAVGESIDTDASEVNSGHSTGATAPAGNSPKTSLFKDTTFGPNAQESAQNIPRKKDGTKDYAALEPAEMFRAIAEDFGEEVAREEIARQIGIYEAKIKKLSDNRSEEINTRLANRTKVQKLQREVAALRDAAGIAEADPSETGGETTAAATAPRTTLRRQSQALGDYLSLEDKILRDIAEGLKFRWTDEGSRRGLATELGFADSPAERRARFNLLARNGMTVDRYAEQLEQEMDHGTVPMSWDTDIRSSILDVLNRVHSNREAFEAAKALRDADPRLEMSDEEARRQEEYDAARGTTSAMRSDEVGTTPFLQSANDKIDTVPFLRSEADEATPEPDFSTTHRAQVEEIVRELNRASGTQAVVFSTLDELPKKARRAIEASDPNHEYAPPKGFYLFGEVYINASEIVDLGEVERVYHHEVGGHRAVEQSGLSDAELQALYRQTAEDIGIDHMRAQNIPELNEAVNAYLTGKMTAMQLGREYIAYSTERFFAPSLYNTTTEPVFSVDLSQPVTDATIKRIIESANRKHDGKSNLTLAAANPRRAGLHDTTPLSDPRGRKLLHAPIYGSDGRLQGDETTSGAGDGTGRGVETGDPEHSRTVSGQDDAGAGRTEPGALPAGETVAEGSESDDIRYRRPQQNETEKNTLVAVHNTTGEQLKKSFSLGGFPMPSIAITQAEMGHAEFGEISLLFDKNSIDPSDRRNRVYGGDAWTPTFPEVGYKLNEKKTSDIYSRANKAGSLPFFNPVSFHPSNYERQIDGLGSESLVKHFLGDYGAKQFYLAETGNAVQEYEQHEVEKYPANKIALYEETLEKIGIDRLKNESYDALEDEVKQLLGRHGIELEVLKPFRVERLIGKTIESALDYAENGNRKTETDFETTKRKIDERVDSKKFEEWLEGLFTGVVEKKGIRNDKEPFTPSGNSRKWESLYDEITLDNVVKAMQKQAAKGGTGLFRSDIFGAATKEFTDLDDIRNEARQRIQALSHEEYQAEKDRLTARLEQVSVPSASGSFSDAMDFVENVKDAVAKSHTPKGIYNYLRGFYSDMTMEVAEEIADIVREIQSMATWYFEAKPYRAVGFDEVRLAVVPSDTDTELVRQLERLHIPVRVYERGNEQQRRELVADATAELDIRFRQKEVDRLSPEQINERFNAELRQQIDGTLPAGHVYRLGRPSSALLSAGIPDLPIELSATRLAEKANPEYASNHPFALEEVADLPRALAEPIAVFDSKTQPGSRVILTELQHDGTNFVVVLRVRKSDDTRNLDVEVNDIRSLYPKDRVGGIINWINNGLLRWVDKEKAAKFISTQWPNYIGGGENPGGSTPKNVVLTQGPNYLAGENDRAISSATNIIKNFANPTLREGEKASAAQTLADELGVRVRVVRSADEISGEESRFREKRGATGWHDRATGEIAVVLANCADAAEVQRTILHEAVGHYGLPELLGRERADELYRRVFDAVRDTRRGRELLDEHGGETVAGDEYLAEMAEGNVTPGVFRRMLAAVRAFFRDALGIDLKLTDADLRYLLWRSKHNLQRARTVSEAMEVIEQDIRLRAQTAHESARERKAERLDKLRRSEPIRITGKEIAPGEDLKQYKKNALEYGKTLRGEYVNRDTGERIMLHGGSNNGGIREILQHDYKDTEHLQSIAAIPQIIEQSVFIDSSVNLDQQAHPNVSEYRYYVSGLDIGGTDYTVKSVVAVDNNGNRYYDHKLTSIEKGKLLELVTRITNPRPSATISQDIAGSPVIQKTGPETTLSEIKDKRLVSVLQAEPLAYQQEAAKSEPKTVMEHLDHLADKATETDKADEIRFRKKREPGPDDPIRTTKENLATRMGRKLQDAHIPVRQLQDYVRKHGGTTDIDTDVYSALNRAFGRQTERMRRTDEKFRQIERRMSEIRRKWGFKYKATEEYLAAKSSQERHAWGIAAYAETTEAPWNRLHVEETIARFESVVPKKMIEALWRDIREMTQHQLDVMKNCDLITVQTYRDIQARGWQYYLPLQGLDFEFEDMADPHKLFDDALTTGRGTGAEALLRKARGRTTKPGDVLATLQRNVHLTIMAGEQNLAKQFLLRLAEQNPQLQGDTRTGKGIFEIEEQWFVRRDDSQITDAERERGEIYEKTLRRPPKEEIERSEAARREMKQAEQELRAVEKKLRSIDPLDGDNDRLAELQDRRIELERRMDEAFDRITVLRTPPPKHAYTGLSKSEEARFEVPIYRHGVRTVVRLSDANAARAINGDFENLFGGAAEEIVSRIGRATRMMAGLNTSWNPEFMLKNKVRDSAWALFYNWLDKEGSARGYLRNQGPAHAAICRYHTNRARPLTMNERAGYDLYSAEGRQRATERYGAARVRDSLYDDFLMEGGLTGYAYMQDLDHYSRRLKKRARRAGNSVMQAFNAAATGFDLLNDLSEVSTRFATFLAQVERGSDVRSAVNYARDVTINFNRRGEWGRDLNALYMFYNASLQGVANLYQLGRRNKTRMGFAMAAVAGLGYGLSFLLNLWLAAMAEEAGDDDEWRVSDYRRFTNICLPGWLVGSTKRVVTIPLPQELRPAWVLGTVLADVTQGRLRADEGWGTAAAIFNSVADAAGESFLPVEVDSKHPLKTFVPSVFKPLYEIGVNANFMGRKIYREAYPGQTIPESQLGMRNTFIAYKTSCEWLNEQAGGSTTVPAGMNAEGEINRWLNLLDVNPSKAEHLFSSYGGGVGRLIVRTWRCIAEPGDERRASDIPFINAFMADVEREENPNTRYYDTKEKLEMLNEVYRRSEREGSFPAYYRSEEEAQAARARDKHWLLELRKTDGRIKKLTQERNETEQGSPEYKALTREMNHLRSDFLLRYDLGAPESPAPEAETTND
ncbi:MAG: hypothetical protein K2G93_03115 [Rikenella sp.]|nr:hypothetical protein [Rikenella sp.]